MGQSKRMRSPDRLLMEQEWGGDVESCKRRKIESRITEREYKSRRSHKSKDRHRREKRSLNRRLDSRERYTRDRSPAMCYEDEDSRGATCLDRDGEGERDWHHYSKSSGYSRSGQSRRTKDRGQGRSHHTRSHHTHKSSYSV